MPASNLPRRIAVLLTVFAMPWAASAAAPQIVPGTVNMFRDITGANDIGSTAGDRLQYGADIVGGSLDVSIGATAATGHVDANHPCGPLLVNPRFCANATGYNVNRLAPWTIHFTNADGTTNVSGPSMVGVGTVPFPTSVTMTGTGLTPTISWSLPARYTPDAFRVNIYDRNAPRSNGVADVISSTDLLADTSSFTLPASLHLSANGRYAIGLQVIETRGHIAFTGNNAQIFVRSNSYFDFTPLTGNVPGDIALPTIQADGVYNFNVDNVGADHITYIDPLVAIGYRYQIGASGPNFRSVVLPDVGDGNYLVSYVDGQGNHSQAVQHDTQFFFGGSGVAAFTVTGIETNAGLDPGNSTAFVTGLTFSGAGAFIGTMTPIAASVPEPRRAALLLGGLAVLVMRRRGVARTGKAC